MPRLCPRRSVKAVQGKNTMGLNACSVQRPPEVPELTVSSAQAPRSVGAPENPLSQEIKTQEISVGFTERSTSGQANMSFQENNYPENKLRSIGPWEPLATLATLNPYNDCYRLKVEMMKEDGYIGWRRVRGDGNCYYRCVGYALLERLFELEPEPRRIAAGDLHEKLSKLTFMNSTDELAHSELLARLEVCRDTGGWELFNVGNGNTLKNPVDTLYESFVDPQGSLDLALVRALRLLLAKYLTEHPDDEAGGDNGGITFETYAIALDYASLEEYTKKVVIPMGLEAMDIVLPAMAKALGRYIRVALLDREAHGGHEDAIMLDFNAEAEAKPSVRVQLRPGHFDLLYVSSA